MAPKRRARRAFNWRGAASALKSAGARSVYVILLGAALLLALFTLSITPERYDLKVGDIAPKTITASKDVVDEITTARQREDAANKVEPSYLVKEGVTDEVLASLDQILAQLTLAQQYGKGLVEQKVLDGTPASAIKFEQTELDFAKTLLTLVTLTDYQLPTLLKASDQQMSDMAQNLTAAVRNTLNTIIREGYVNESIQYVQQIVGYKTDTSLLQNVVTPVLRKCVKPNMVIDQEATQKAQEQAREAVEPVVYKQGQNIVLARERISLVQLELLRSLGLLDDDTVDQAMFIGAGALVVIVMLTMLAILMLLAPHMLRDPRKLTILMLVLVLSLALCVLANEINVYAAPALLGAMMLTGLLGAPAGIAGGIALSLLASLLVAGGDSTYSTEMLHLLLSSFVGAFIAVTALRNRPRRQQVLLCGIYTACSNFAVVLSIGLMTNNSVQGVVNSALWAAVGATVSAVLCIGLDPVLEALFNLATPARLMELCNPNQPLMRRLLLEAPGTYHHSIIVANLAEAAAEAIGANPLLARAGAYYHDIGKLKRPLYFKENQIGDNPHEHTDPYVSAAIVTAHTRDGVMMAQQYKLPVEIQRIIGSHHGDAPAMFFYHKALQQAAGKSVDIADFRYDGKPPDMREAAIVMLADTIEAAVRAMPDPTPAAIEAFIVRLVRGKLEDGQLSNAPITLSDIDKICAAFTTVLNGVFHERIEYPTVSVAEEQQALPEGAGAGAGAAETPVSGTNAGGTAAVSGATGSGAHTAGAEGAAKGTDAAGEQRVARTDTATDDKDGASDDGDNDDGGSDAAIPSEGSAAPADEPPMEATNGARVPSGDSGASPAGTAPAGHVPEGTNDSAAQAAQAHPTVPAGSADTLAAKTQAAQAIPAAPAAHTAPSANTVPSAHAVPSANTAPAHAAPVASSPALPPEAALRAAVEAAKIEMLATATIPEPTAIPLVVEDVPEPEPLHLERVEDFAPPKQAAQERGGPQEEKHVR